jgi:hypothetical protein
MQALDVLMEVRICCPCTDFLLTNSLYFAALVCSCLGKFPPGHSSSHLHLLHCYYRSRTFLRIFVHNLTMMCGGGATNGRWRNGVWAATNDARCCYLWNRIFRIFAADFLHTSIMLATIVMRFCYNTTMSQARSMVRSRAKIEFLLQLCCVFATIVHNCCYEVSLARILAMPPAKSSVTSPARSLVRLVLLEY